MVAMKPVLPPLTQDSLPFAAVVGCGSYLRGAGDAPMVVLQGWHGGHIHSDGRRHRVPVSRRSSIQKRNAKEKVFARARERDSSLLPFEGSANTDMQPHTYQRSGRMVANSRASDFICLPTRDNNNEHSRILLRDRQRETKGKR